MGTIMRRVTIGVMALTMALGLALGAVAVSPASADAAPIRSFGAEGDCYYAGKRYSEGSERTQDGYRYVCRGGKWKRCIGDACPNYAFLLPSAQLAIQATRTVAETPEAPTTGTLVATAPNETTGTLVAATLDE